MANQRILYTEEAVGYGHPTKTDVVNRMIMVEHAEDGTHKLGTISGMLLATSGVITALTGAQRFYTNYFTRNIADASADVNYTGTGFVPGAVIFLYFVVDTANRFGIGFDDGTRHMGIVPMDTGAGMELTSTKSIYAYVASGAGSQTAFVKSMNADGFTLTWTKTNSPTGTLTVIFLALR